MAFSYRVFLFQGESVLIKKIMILQSRIESSLRKYTPYEVGISTLYHRMVELQNQGLAFSDRLGEKVPFYRHGRNIVTWMVNGPFFALRNGCSWAFTKSEREKQIINFGYKIPLWGSQSFSSPNRRAQSLSQEKRIENITLASEDYARVCARIFIVYYVAWWACAFLGYLQSFSLPEKNERTGD